MALKKLPGGVVYEDNGGARLNEEAAVNLEAIHRQLGARGEAAADRAELAAGAATGEPVDRSLPAGASMDTLGPGMWRVTSAAIAGTIVSRPPEAVAAQGATIRVMPVLQSGGSVVQRWQIAPNAAQPALAWERHKDNAGNWSAWRRIGPDAVTLTTGADIRALTPGTYVVPNFAVASTLVGRPEGALAWGQNPSTITVTGSETKARTIVLRTAPAAAEVSRTLVMHRDNGGTWSGWSEEGTTMPAARTLAAGEDYHTLAPGSYVVPTLAVGGSMLNGPTGTLSWAKGAATVTVVSGTARNASILLVETPAAAQAPRMAVKHRDNSGAWGDWNQVGAAPSPASTLAGRVLTTGEDYHTLPAGSYIVPTLAVGQSLLNGPTGALSWAKGASTVTVVAGAAKNASILLVETPNASLKPRMVVKHRDNAGTWGPWNEVGATAAGSTAGLTGEAALPTLAPLAAVQHAAARTAVRLMAGTLPADHPARWTAPAGTKLTIPTPDGTGQAVHPKVLDTGTPGFGGFRYWMAMTPYAWANDALEDPCLLVSQDGTAWQAAPDVPTPLDDQPGSPEHYNSDTHLVLRDGTMYAIWRTSKNGAAPDRISWRTSTDGQTWTPTQVIYEGGNLGTVYGQMLSPALIPEGDGWRMYLVAPNTHPNQLVWVETTAATPTPEDWSAPTRCVLDAGDTHILGRDVWHIDVVQNASGWWLLLNDCIPRTGGIDGDLILARSTDGTTWTSGRGPLLPRYAAHHDALYRGTLIPREDGSIDVWYSARVRQNQKWTISRTLAQKDC